MCTNHVCIRRCSEPNATILQGSAPGSKLTKSTTSTSAWQTENCGQMDKSILQRSEELNTITATRHNPLIIANNWKTALSAENYTYIRCLILYSRVNREIDAKEPKSNIKLLMASASACGGLMRSYSSERVLFFVNFNFSFT